MQQHLKEKRRQMDLKNQQQQQLKRQKKHIVESDTEPTLEEPIQKKNTEPTLELPAQKNTKIKEFGELKVVRLGKTKRQVDPQLFAFRNQRAAAQKSKLVLAKDKSLPHPLFTSRVI